MAQRPHCVRSVSVFAVGITLDTTRLIISNNILMADAQTAQRGGFSKMADKAPAFQFYPRDWDTDINVVPMTLEEEGVYWALCRIYWLNGPLPADLKELRLLVKGHPPLKKMQAWWHRIGRCFQEEDGRLYHKRLEEERQKQYAWREKSVEAGRRSAEARLQKFGSNQPRTKPEPTFEPSREPTSNRPVRESLEPIPNSSSASSSAVPSEDRTEEKRRAQNARAREPGPEPAFMLKSARLELIATWNEATGPPFTAVRDPASWRDIDAALQECSDMHTWRDRFRRVAKSLFLRQQAHIAPADLWFVLKHVNELDAGRYDDRMPKANGRHDATQHLGANAWTRAVCPHSPCCATSLECNTRIVDEGRRGDAVRGDEANR